MRLGWGRDDGAFSVSCPGRSAARVLRAGVLSIFAWGCFRDFLSRPCRAPPKGGYAGSRTQDRQCFAIAGRIDSTPTHHALAARWRCRRYARRCRCAGGVGRCHRAGRCQVHRHALGAGRRVRCRHHARCRIDAGVGKYRDCGLNRARRGTARNFGRRERQSGAVGRRTSGRRAAYGGRWAAQRRHRGYGPGRAADE